MVMTKTTNYVKKIRVAIYVRVSTKEQAMEGYSIGEQTERLKKFAEAHDWVIVNVYTDAGHSGADLDRPALEKMIEDLKAGKIDKVLVYKLDRLSRSQKDTLKLIEDIFLPNNTDFESMTEKLDTATAHGRAMIGILAAFAQLEREMITERMSMGLQARIKEGKWRGGAQVPFGYNYDKAHNKLTINEWEAEIVKSLFNRYLDGEALYYIAETMLENGQTLRNGKVDRRNLRYMLRSKVYCGYQRYQDEWIKSNHDSIITEELFNKVQERLDNNLQRFEEAGFKTGVKATSTNLGGMLYCGKCGARYHRSRTGTKQYGFHWYYKCYSQSKQVKTMIKDPNCTNTRWRIEDLDNLIFGEIKKLAIDPEYINQLRKAEEKTETGKEIHAIEQQIKSINAQISRFMDLYSLGKFDMDELDQKTEALTEQKNKLAKTLAKLKKDNTNMTNEDVIQIVSNFDEVLECGSLADRRAILEKLINRIEIKDEEVIIHWNFL